jgi:alkyldihydroxyacetonephosphate synthase
MRIHANPPFRVYHGFLFPSFEEGVAAMHTCVHEGHRPSLLRLSDAHETELSFHMKPPSSGFQAVLHGILKRYLAARGYAAPCLMIVGLEGTRARVRKLRKHVFRILRAHRGFHLGKGAGESWSKEKFNLPYLRDTVMDRGVLVDVAETATLWSNVVPLYRTTQRAFADHCLSLGIRSYMGCHISHTYETGACLYFTYAAPQDRNGALERYYDLKRFITGAFLESGAALSHHHAIGVEHRPWMTQEHSPAALRALRSLKSSLDPRNIMNPGKVLPPELDKKDVEHL